MNGFKFLRTVTVGATLLFASIAAPLVAAETNVFLEAGVPSPERDWASYDYTRIAKIFSSSNAPLPKLSDPAGRKVFMRMVSTNNFAQCQSKSLPIDFRLQECSSLMIASGEIMKSYLREMIKGAKMEAETARLCAFILHLSATSWELVEEYKPMIPKDDKYQTRIEGLEKARSGMTTVFAGASRVLTNPKDLAEEDRRILLDAMAATLPTLKRAFSESYLGELKAELRRSQGVFKGPVELKDIEAMLKTIDSR